MTLQDHIAALEDAATPEELEWALAGIPPEMEGDLAEHITAAEWEFESIGGRV